MGKLEGYKAVITGATSGIGLGIAKAFLDEGAVVIGLGRDFHRTTELGGNFIPFKCELYNPDEIKAAAAFANERFCGCLDVLVNNAGRGTYGQIESFEDKEFDELFYLLLRAPMLVTRDFLPMLSNRKNASILNISSVSGMYLDTEQFMYSIAKEGLIKFTQITAKTFASRGIRANSICPGVIDTPIFQWSPKHIQDDFDFNAVASILPCKRIGQPEDIAHMAVLLSGEEGAYISGANIPIDGGLVIL